jgi:transposase-like protein
MMRERRKFTGAYKAPSCAAFLVGQEPVSTLADVFGNQPTTMYNWAKDRLGPGGEGISAR